MSRSGAWRRGQTALHDGFLINVEDRPGYPARLKLGDPLPPARPILPNPDELFSVTPPKTAQRLNTQALKPATMRKTGVARGVDSSEVLSQRLEARNSSRNGPFPRGSAENPEGVALLRGFARDNERGLLSHADRAWDAAWTLDELLGNEKATSYLGARLIELGEEPELAAVTELADRLESRLRKAAR
jgi:hypothetical protein